MYQYHLDKQLDPCTFDNKHYLYRSTVYRNSTALKTIMAEKSKQTYLNGMKQM